jgi:hypothetical protein
VPVGVPDPEDLVTVAVKVTGLPRPDGLGVELSIRASQLLSTDNVVALTRWKAGRFGDVAERFARLPRICNEF